MKSCSRCKETKDETFFYKRAKAWDGYSPHCKACQTKVTQSLKYKEQAKQRLERNPDQKDRNRVYQKEWANKNRDKVRLVAKEYRKNNKERYKKMPSQSRERKNLAFKSHYNNNKKNIIEKTSIYRNNHKERFSEIRSERMKNDVLFALRRRVSCRIKNAMSKIKNFSKDTSKFIGSDFETVKKHIESQFKEGMSWDNNTKDGWHIDHIIPLSSAKTEEELIKLFHYTNLQPLWWYENLSKGNKILANL